VAWQFQRKGVLIVGKTDDDDEVMLVALEEHDDVQAVYANFDIPEDVLQEVEA